MERPQVIPQVMNTGCDVSPRVVALQLELHLIFSVSAPPSLREHSCSSHPNKDNAQQRNWALQLLDTARPAINVVWEGQFLLLCYRKLSNNNVHLESSLASRLGCMLLSTQRSPAFLVNNKETAGVKALETCSIFSNFDYSLKKQKRIVM